MFPARRLARRATNNLLHKPSIRGAYISCYSQAKKNDAWSGGGSWWSSSSAFSAAFAVMGAGFVVSLANTKDSVLENNGISLSKLSRVIIPTELSPTKTEENREEEPEDETTDVINWSGTHQVSVLNKNYWEPESVEEVEKIVKGECSEVRCRARASVSGLNIRVYRCDFLFVLSFLLPHGQCFIYLLIIALFFSISLSSIC